MNRSKVAYLISESYSQDEYGVMIPDEEERKVYVSVTSVTGNEWFEGGRNGLNPQYRFTMFSHDYQCEKIIEYNEIRYTIYRTYMKTTDEIELYCELKKGSEQVIESGEDIQVG